MPNTNHVSRFTFHASRLNALLSRIENAMLCLILLLVIGMALLKIVLRYLFHTGILWDDVMLQHFTLWLVFLGAALAACEKRHISIDILPRFFPPRLARFAAIVIDAVSFFVVSILAYTSIEFLRDEQLSDATLVGNVPLWWAKLIIPLGFILIALHFVIHVIIGIRLPIYRVEE